VSSTLLGYCRRRCSSDDA